MKCDFCGEAYYGVKCVNPDCVANKEKTSQNGLCMAKDCQERGAVTPGYHNPSYGRYELDNKAARFCLRHYYSLVYGNYVEFKEMTNNLF